MAKPPEERRANVLTEEQVEELKERILASVYEDIGRSLVKKGLWALVAVLAALLTWLAAKGYVKPLVLGLAVGFTLYVSRVEAATTYYYTFPGGNKLTLHQESCAIGKW